MSAYFIANYDITDPEGYARYNPGSMGLIMETLMRHGGEVLAAGKGADVDWLDEDSRHVYVVLKFPSVKAAHAWHDDPDYAAAKAIRLAATTNRHVLIAPAFTPPA